jgi:hypothetical protein
VHPEEERAIAVRSEVAERSLGELLARGSLLANEVALIEDLEALGEAVSPRDELVRDDADGGVEGVSQLFR